MSGWDWLIIFALGLFLCGYTWMVRRRKRLGRLRREAEALNYAIKEYLKRLKEGN